MTTENTFILFFVIVVNSCLTAFSVTLAMNGSQSAIVIVLLQTRDVTKLVKIRMRILTFKIRRMRIQAFILSVGT